MEYAMLTQEHVLELPMDVSCQIPPFYLKKLGLCVVDAGNGLPQWVGTKEEFTQRLVVGWRNGSGI
jgi:hypothetical protein